MYLSLFFCLSLAVVFSAIHTSAEVYGCNKISTTLNVQFKDNNYTVSANVGVEKIKHLTVLSITNVTFNGPINVNDTAIGIDYLDFDQQITLNPSYSDGVIAGIDNNSSFTLVAGLQGTGIPIFDGIIDEYSLSPAFIGLFSKQKPCYTTNYDVLQNFCCISFFEIPETKNSTVTKCKQFKSQTILYNATDNYNIIASSTMYYNISKKTITTYGSINAPAHYGITYVINGNDDNLGYCNDLNLPNLNCTYAIPDENMKILFTNRFHNYYIGDPNLPDLPLENYAKLGRIIFRSNFTLMEEGMPFTKKNNCLYNSDGSYEKYVVYNQFCCQDFESFIN